MRDGSFDEYVVSCLPALNRYAYALTGDLPGAEILVRDALARLAWSGRRRAGWHGDPFGDARTIMFRRYLSPWRALWRHWSPSTNDTSGFDARAVLRRALNDLPRAQRAVLVLAYLDGLHDDAIARVLRRRPAAVRSLRERGLRVMRGRLVDTGRAAEIGPIGGGRALTLVTTTLGLRRARRTWDGWQERRRRRRRRAAVAAAPLAVLLAAGGTGLAVLWYEGQASGVPSTASPGELVRESARYPRILGLGFAGRYRGYLLTNSCRRAATGGAAAPGAPAADPGVDGDGLACQQRLTTSADGGHTWQNLPLPDEDLLNHDPAERAGQAGDRLPLLSVIGPDTLLLYSGSRDRRWLSVNGGRTWRADKPWPLNTTTSIPPDGWLAVNEQVPGRRWLEVVSADGTASVLAGGPKDAEPGRQVTNDGVIRATDGSYWLRCAAGDACAVVTRDHGNTWQTIRPRPLPPGPVSSAWISTLDGRTVYLGVSGDGVSGDGVGGDGAAGARRVTRLFHSADGGVTWTVAPLPGAADPGTADLGAADRGAEPMPVDGAEVLPNGDLLAAVDGVLYRMPAAGGGFQVVAGAPAPMTALTRSGPWLVAITGTGPDPALVHLSLDALTWTPVRLP